MAPEETAPGDRSDRQREEDKEADVPDGVFAVPPVSQRRAQEKHRYHTVGHQVHNSQSALNHVCHMKMLLNNLLILDQKRDDQK